MKIESDTISHVFIADDGSKIDPETIPIPELCRSCGKIEIQESACILTRFDQQQEVSMGEMFCCFAFQSREGDIDTDRRIREMEAYLRKKNSLFC